MTVYCPGWIGTDSHLQKDNKYQLLYTYSCTSWWWALIRPKHVQGDEIYWEIVVDQVGFSSHNYIEMHGQQNIKKNHARNVLGHSVPHNADAFAVNSRAWYPRFRKSGPRTFVSNCPTRCDYVQFIIPGDSLARDPTEVYLQILTFWHPNITFKF